MKQAELAALPPPPVEDGPAEAIDGRIGVHDSNHVEVKLDYHLADGEESRYRVETYFFVPRSLGLNEETYSRQHFYDDVQTYIRFKTPTIPLDALSEDGPQSPLAQVRRLANALQRTPKRRDLERQLEYELRMFGCVVRANLRDRVSALSVRIQELPRGDRARTILVEDVREIAGRFLSDVDVLLREWRAMRATILTEPTPRRAQDTYALVDEYLSIVVELKLTTLIKRLDKAPALEGVGRDFRERARTRILAEREYREGAGYASGEGMATDGTGEELVYRRGMLKKLVTSVLWLEIDKQREGRTFADVAAGIAAGVAMLFTAVATILSLRWWMINTAGFVVAAVLIYILKDRMKDWIKRFFASRMSRFLADYNVAITDPLTGVSLGRSREGFAYVPIARVPEKVLELRRAKSRSAVETEAKREVVFKYDKEIRLKSQRLIERMHLEEYDLNDITRIALWQLMVRADDPETRLPVYDEHEDRVRKKIFHKVYHLNMVMVFRAGPRSEAVTTMRHLRVVFDKKAIRRLEEVGVA